MGQFWPRPAWTQNGPKRAQNHQNRCPNAPRQVQRAPAGSSDPIPGRNPLGLCGLPFRFVVSVFCPEMVSDCPIWAHLFPVCVPWSESKNWPYIWLDCPNCNSEGTLSLCQPPLLRVSNRQNSPNAPLDVGFARLMHIWPGFGVFWPARAHQKWVQSWCFSF